MSNSIQPASLDDLFNLFSDTLNPSDVLAAKAMSSASKSITKERVRLNLTQSQFAEKLHVKQSLISRWESGQCNFSIQKLSEIAAELDMNLVVQLQRKPKLNYSYYDGYTSVSRKRETFQPGSSANRSSKISKEDMFISRYDSTNRKECIKC